MLWGPSGPGLAAAWMWRVEEREVGSSLLIKPRGGNRWGKKEREMVGGVLVKLSVGGFGREEEEGIYTVCIV